MSEELSPSEERFRRTENLITTVIFHAAEGRYSKEDAQRWASYIAEALLSSSREIRHWAGFLLNQIEKMSDQEFAEYMMLAIPQLIDVRLLITYLGKCHDPQNSNHATDNSTAAKSDALEAEARRLLDHLRKTGPTASEIRKMKLAYTTELKRLADGHPIHTILTEDFEAELNSIMETAVSIALAIFTDSPICEEVKEKINPTSQALTQITEADFDENIDNAPGYASLWDAGTRPGRKLPPWDEVVRKAYGRDRPDQRSQHALHLMISVVGSYRRSKPLWAFVR